MTLPLFRALLWCKYAKPNPKRNVVKERWTKFLLFRNTQFAGFHESMILPKDMESIQLPVKRCEALHDKKLTAFKEKKRKQYENEDIPDNLDGNEGKEKLYDLGRTDRLISRPKDQTEEDIQKRFEKRTDINQPKFQEELEIKALLFSDDVLKAIARVIQHFSSIEGKAESELDIERVRKCLSSITSYQCSGRAKGQSPIIQNEAVSSAQREGFKRDYASENQGTKDSIIETCVNLCRDKIPMPAGAIPFLRPIFHLAYEKKPIEDCLNLPVVGSYIHTDLHIFLDQNPGDFVAGQYVAYEVFDPALSDQEGDAVYVIARIKGIVAETSGNLWRRKYKIDIGKITEVTGADLYAFLGKLHTLITGTDPGTDSGSGEDRKSVQEVKAEIDHQLKETCHTDETIGKKAAKRLLLKWLRADNPDKSKVEDHIFNLVQQLNEKKTPNF